MNRKDAECPAEAALNVIGGRWKILILYHLFDGVKRFSELQRAMDKVTQKMLTQQLREMERDGLVHREVYPQVPPKVEYSLTPLGESLEPVVETICEWGMTLMDEREKRGSQDYAPDPSARQSDRVM